jgi:hypothetical protein
MDRNVRQSQGWPSAGLCKSKNEAASVGGLFLVANVAYWPITTFRRAAEFGRFRGNSGFGQPNTLEDLWVHGLVAKPFLSTGRSACLNLAHRDQFLIWSFVGEAEVGARQSSPPQSKLTHLRHHAASDLQLLARGLC